MGFPKRIRFISEPSHCRKPLIDSSCSQSERLDLEAKSKNNGPIESKARF